MTEFEDKQNCVYINYENIFEYGEDDMSYLFVDKAEVLPGIEAHGIKLASTQDWYFKIHFPGNPMMPGVFIMESIMTTGSLILYTMPEKKGEMILFNGCKDVRIYRSVRPGDILDTYVKLESYKRGIASFSGEASVEGRLVCKMHFTMTVPSELPQI